jgi:50S ribosome-binding GTPase
VRRREPHAQSITVGVVGYPNVGKSSLINSLKRVKVSAKPGHTQDLQSVQLERGIRIVYSPGVIFDNDDASVMLRNWHAQTHKPYGISTTSLLSLPHLSFSAMASFLFIMQPSRILPVPLCLSSPTSRYTSPHAKRPSLSAARALASHLSPNSSACTPAIWIYPDGRPGPRVSRPFVDAPARRWRCAGLYTFQHECARECRNGVSGPV